MHGTKQEPNEETTNKQKGIMKKKKNKHGRKTY